MKSKHISNRHPLLIAITLAGYALAAPSAFAATYYWDNTSPLDAAGFGTAGGTWGTDAFWSLSSLGTDSTGIASPSNTDDLNFGTATDVLGAGTVTVTGIQSANSLIFASGTGAIILSGGTIDLAAIATITIDSAAAQTINSDISGAATSLTKAGTGTLTLGGNNSHIGQTIVNSAGATATPVLTVAHNNALGTTAGGTVVNASNTTGNGSQLNLATGITVTGETLTLDATVNGYRASLISAGAATWDGNVVLTGIGGLLAFNNNGATASLTVGTSSATTVTGSSNTLTLRGSGAGTGTVNSTISTGSISKTDACTWKLAAPNTYTGTTNISVGTLSINTIQNVGGGVSSLGAPTTIPDGTITIGSTTTQGTAILLYTGTGNTTDRVINLAGTTGAATLTQSGVSGLLKFTSDFTATGIGSKTLTLQGSTAGTGEIAGAIVNNGTIFSPTLSANFAAAATTITVGSTAGYNTGSRITGTGLAAHTTITAINTGTGVLTISPAATGAGSAGQTMTVTAITALTKTGTGTWTISGSNTYTGVTTISQGVLVLGSASALPGGIATTGGTGGLAFNGGILGLANGDFTRSYSATAGNIGTFSAPANAGAGWAAYGADRIVNVGGAGVSTTFFNGKPIVFGAADSTHMVEFKNGLQTTSVTRLVVANRGITPGGVDGLLSGVITETAGVLAGLDKTGNGTMALTGASTFTGSVLIKNGTIVVNSFSNTGIASPTGQGLSGVTLLGGTFKYAPVTPAGGVATGGAATSTNRNFGISASSSIDASGTGAVVFNAPAGNIISPDVTGIGFTATGANKILTLAPGNTTNLAVGMTVTGPGIASGSTIASIVTTTGTLVTAITLTSSVNVAITAGGETATFGYPTARTLTLTGTNTDANTLAGVLQDSSATGAGVLSIAKEGVGTWTLTGANTYTGNTTVTAGSLVLSGTAIPNANSLSVTGSGTVSVAGAGTETVGSLTLGATTYTSGSFTSANSSGFVTSGTIQVGAAAGGYSAWAALNGAAASLSDDHDFDGVSNGVEYFIGGPTGNTTGFTAVPSIVNVSGVRSVTFVKAGTYLGAYGTDYLVETSTTLAGAWTVEAADPTPGFTVTFPSANEVKYTFPAGPVKTFARLKVTGP